MQETQAYDQCKPLLIQKVQKYIQEEQKFIDSFKQWNGSKIQMQNNNVYKAANEKKSVYEGLIKQVQQYFSGIKQDIQSLPQFKEEVEQREVCMYNSHIENNCVKLRLSGDGYNFSNKFIIVSIDSQSKKIEGLQNPLNSELQINLDNLKKSIKSKHILKIEVWKKGIFLLRSEKMKGSIEIGMDEMATCNYLQKEVKFNLDD